MDEPQELQLGMSWARAFRVVVHHPAGDIAVYAVHLPSVRPGDTAARDAAVNELAALVAADPVGRVLVMGDLNTAGTDPTLSALTAELADSRETVKGGFGFTWPASFPLTRPDHVLGRGLTPVSDQVLLSGGSDHRAVWSVWIWRAEPVRRGSPVSAPFAPPSTMTRYGAPSRGGAR